MFILADPVLHRLGLNRHSVTFPVDSPFENRPTAPRIPSGAGPRDHYQDLVSEVWRRILVHRRLIVGSVVTSALLAVLLLVIVGPRYTAEAVIRLTFTRDEPASGGRSQAIAVMDASSIVESAARMIRSRAIASAVVTRLDRERSAKGDGSVSPDLARSRNPEADTYAHERAVARLMSHLRVSTELRSYLITVSVTEVDPGVAATYANAFAVQYLCGLALQQAIESYAAAEREAAEVSSIYGTRHPSYVAAQARLATLDQRISALRFGRTGTPEVDAVVSQSLVPAEKVLVPSGPRASLWLLVAVLLGLAFGIALALLLELECVAPIRIFAVRAGNALHDRTKGRFSRVLRAMQP